MSVFRTSSRKNRENFPMMFLLRIGPDCPERESELRELRIWWVPPMVRLAHHERNHLITFFIGCSIMVEPALSKSCFRRLA